MKSSMAKKYVDRLTEKITLNLCKVGCDKDNFKILNTIPMNVKDLMNTFNLTKMPMNKRINELEKVGLLERNRWKGEVKPTKLTKKFLKIVSEMKIKIKDDLPNLV